MFFILCYFLIVKRNIIVYSKSIILNFKFGLDIEEENEKTSYQGNVRITISSVTFEEKDENKKFKSEVSIETNQEDYASSFPGELPESLTYCASTVLANNFLIYN